MLPADSLVTAHLRLAACESLMAHLNPHQAATLALSTADVAAAVARALDTWVCAAEALRARHAADTLFTCSPDEDAFAVSSVVTIWTHHAN